MRTRFSATALVEIDAILAYLSERNAATASAVARRLEQ
jgi:hypothetical protein